MTTKRFEEFSYAHPNSPGCEVVTKMPHAASYFRRAALNSPSEQRRYANTQQSDIRQKAIHRLLPQNGRKLQTYDRDTIHTKNCLH